MMKFMLFLGCNIPARVRQYEASARAVMKTLDIEILDSPEFKCCGNPIRNADARAFILMAARNLALAEKQGLDMMVLCKCCFGSLKKAAHLLAHAPGMQEDVNTLLKKEGLVWSGKSAVRHFLSVLYHDIGPKALKDRVKKPFKKLRIAAHTGCHALRPSEITRFDDPAVPVILDELVAVTGASSIDWPMKSECCGAPVLGVQDTLSMDLTQKKLDDCKRVGADFICVACPFCQMQFDRVQQVMALSKEISPLCSILYPQLLGLSMGIGSEALGIHRHIFDVRSIESFFDEEK